ncbi:hypothetical protein [Bowmanella dokdonensis]|uniref:Uncharacterized protein n=1 Tax=Bowmanella dokdonensis TaxID=751969 RepID=A0A939DJK8_9ALTE|nr:hypothetical protein [Bowmanella dokdonensis]MBN7823673.1 hypothetical protein [Bowmanella dokdonensis]
MKPNLVKKLEIVPVNQNPLLGWQKLGLSVAGEQRFFKWTGSCANLDA